MSPISALLLIVLPFVIASSGNKAANTSQIELQQSPACEFFQPLANYSFHEINSPKNRSSLIISMKTNANEPFDVNWNSNGEFTYLEPKDGIKRYFKRNPVISRREKNEICQCLSKKPINNQFLKNERDVLCGHQCNSKCRNEKEEISIHWSNGHEIHSGWKDCMMWCEVLENGKFLNFENAQKQIKQD